jgi:hypothetical protein
VVFELAEVVSPEVEAAAVAVSERKDRDIEVQARQDRVLRWRF